MSTVRDLLHAVLSQHLELNPGEPHGTEYCSLCLLLTAVAVLANTAGVLEKEALGIQPAVPYA